MPDTTALRRMTAAQYRNTVRDLFGVEVEEQVFPASERGAHGFSTDAQANATSEIGVYFILGAAEAVAEQAVVDLENLLPCAPTDLNESCVADFIATYGARAYRRPLELAERDTLLALWNTAPSDISTADRVAMLIEAMLQSPQFLYITQGGGLEVEETSPSGEALVQLTDWEVAARLSYFLWETMPDAELFAAAQREELRTSEQIEQQARRMLDDARADATIARFHREWLRIENLRSTPKSSEVYPQFDLELAESMAEETRRFVLDTFRSDGVLADLLLGRTTWMNQRLAQFYGVSSSSSDPDAWVATEYPATRIGLLTQASVMAVHADRSGSNPVKRGAFLQHEIMCMDIPPPPPGIPPLGDPQTGQSKRDVLESHRADPACAGCHALLDPPGLAFEHYDGIGAWRLQDNGEPIDASGELVTAGGSLGGFDNAVDMIALLAATDAVHACYTHQWFHFTMGRNPNSGDHCAIEGVAQTFIDEGGDIEQLLIHLVTHPSFRHRLAEAGQ